LKRNTDGKETLIDIHSPVARTIRVFGSMSPAVVVVDDLRIRRHLGEAIEQVALSL
jgi:hypothetical protein